MELEKEIQQSKFKNEKEKALINILFTGNWLNALNGRFLKENFKKDGFEISTQQYNVLRILRGSYPGKMMLNDIQKRMLDRMSNASRLVDKLVMNGLASRKESNSDRRKVDILITEKGLNLLNEIDYKMYEVNQHFDRISEDEAFTLNRILDKLRG